MRGFVVILIPEAIAKENANGVNPESIMNNAVVTPVITTSEEEAVKMVTESNKGYVPTGVMSYEMLTHLTGLIVNLAKENNIEIQEQK